MTAKIFSGEHSADLITSYINQAFSIHKSCMMLIKFANIVEVEFKQSFNHIALVDKSFQ
jgi:hypothetical protein